MRVMLTEHSLWGWFNTSSMSADNSSKIALTKQMNYRTPREKS